MKDKINDHVRNLFLVLMALVIFAAAAGAQTTNFAYQGKLSDMGTPPTGTYQMEFRLFDTAAGGAQIGGTVTNNAVSVVDGVFSVTLSFGGSGTFTGADRFLQISVRRNAGEGFVTLNPRQQIASSPYSIRTLSAVLADNSERLGGVPANQYLQTNGSGSGLTNLNADSITAGTLSNARLGQIPTANIADSAVTAAKIAAGQVVKSVNTLRDDITLAAGNNITITPAGNTLTIAATGGASGVTGSGTVGRVPMFSGTSAIGDSLISQNAGAVQMPGRVEFAPNAQGNSVIVGTPNTEVGLTLSNAASRSDIRFSGSKLKLVAGPAGGPPSDFSGIVVDASGRVTIGATSTTSSKFAVAGGFEDGATIGSTSGIGLNVTSNTGTALFANVGTANGYAAELLGKVSVLNDLEIEGAGRGIVLKSPSGNRCVRITIDEAGNLVNTILNSCP